MTTPAVQGGEICADACHALAKRAEASACFTNFPTFALRQRCPALPHASPKTATWLVYIKARHAQPLPRVDFVGPLAQLGHETRVLVDARFFCSLQASINTSKQFSWQFLLENQPLAQSKVGVFCAQGKVFCAQGEVFCAVMVRKLVRQSGDFCARWGGFLCNCRSAPPPTTDRCCPRHASWPCCAESAKVGSSVDRPHLYA